MEWTNDKVIAFLELISTEPCLWDPSHIHYKNRFLKNYAWRRVAAVLPFKTTIEEMKKKKKSLLGYYRKHLKRYKTSLKSGAGNKDVYKTTWFAYETMDSYLGKVYDRDRTLNTEKEISEGENVENDNSRNLSPDIVEALQKTRMENTNGYKEISEGENVENDNSRNLSPDIVEALQKTRMENTNGYKEISEGENVENDNSRNLSPDIVEALQKTRMDEAFEYMKNKKDDEYEMFGKLIASKLQKMRNPNTRDILMNNIHDLVTRTCLMDRLEQQSEVAILSNISNPGPSTSQSPNHKVLIPSPNPSPHHSPPGSSTSQSP